MKASAKTQRLTGLALMTGIIIVLQIVASFIKFGPFTITLALAPIIIGAALYGAGAGAYLGGVFGVMAVIGCINGSDGGGAMVYQANPVLCIVVVMAKGILAGLAAGLVYRLFQSKNGYLAMLCAAIVCPVVNTGVFLACMALFFREVLQAWADGSDVVTYVLSGLVLLNFLPELGVNVIFSPAGQRIVQAVRKV